MKKTILVGITAFVLGTCVWNTEVVSEAKSKEIVMVEGSSRKISTNYSDYQEVTSDNKKKASVKAGDFFVLVKAKKKGTVTISYKGVEDSKGKAYTVNVLAKKTVKNKSKKALNRVVKGLGKGTEYAFVDFNYDGIEDLYYNGKIAYYNYGTNKVVTKNYHFKDIYISKKTKKVLGVYKDKYQRVTDFFVYTCEYFEPDTSKLFSLSATGTGYRTYTEDGTKEYAVNKPYAYYDTGYDQDDYDYQAYSEEEVIKQVKKKMPDCKKLELTVR